MFFPFPKTCLIGYVYSGFCFVYSGSVRFQDHPLSFEQDIKTLLAQKATEE
ncbi:hypothetical protein PF010_g18942 [Phytophthora fragariae]|uniref:Uncharacterized protein n=1 Tax=Phytophthora fragariae TaxID=53985 RepID=A0A6A3R9S4_9STRA|nr:hypothetical protein PF011_g18430 [Phytophthora fragariae]KAE9089174.1 hypothetical protein PF007_g19691 [Phytophthora fragariae]KAE9089552.1 hypothetical protein PF010_g18942 [Phytophthora fragariae]KAE9118277.1 hypothetical protein PF006_g18633 [Phytophthora fragariae]KAE9201953.1 hypothetical protein PF004_g18558 [Phytophthora fragariae]